MSNKIALFGGVYSNHLALEKTIEDVQSKGITDIFCLGDLGAFGPFPDKVFPLLIDNNVKVIQGNYDHSIGNHLDDCACGYTDPRDNYYARLSYKYTYDNTNEQNKKWLKNLLPEIRLLVNGKKILICHGSPRLTNEFLWESTTPTHFLSKLFKDYNADVICTTHTGIHWRREVPEDKFFVNVGVIGRPENDGTTEVGYTILEIENDGKVTSEYIRISYDYELLAEEMKAEKLPKEFIDTIETGWWTTCLEILPSKERIKGKF